MTIEDYSRDEHTTSRILNALWNKLYPRENGRPKSWHPTRSQVSELNILHVPNVGPKSRAVIQLWLKGRRESATGDEGHAD